MKSLNGIPRMDIYGDGYLGDEKNGAFRIRDGKDFYLVVASDGLGFDHVSVSKHRNSGANINKCPTLDEMKKIKNIFFEENEVVYQIFPKQEEYVNEHPYCLHLWRPNDQDFDLPPYASISDEDLIEMSSFPLDNCICAYKLFDLEQWTLLRASILTSGNQLIKNGPTWEQTCQIKERVFGLDKACAEFMFDSNHHESSVDIYLPKNPKMLITPPSILVGHKKKY